MAHVWYPFKKTNITLYQKPASIVTDDTIYWKKLGSPFLIKEFGAVDYLSISPIEPYYFAATTSVRIQILDPITKVVVKSLAKFVKGAYGANFRKDGKLVISGSEDSTVKLIDVQSKNVLRAFTGHTGPVHRAYFTKDQVKVISFSDDKTVGLWDIATEEKLATINQHTDYVRCGAASPISPEIILSGSYDNTAKIYDCRSNETVLSVHHGSPLESTIFLPSGGLFLTGGGTEIKVWDLFNGGKLLASMSQHHKSVTTLCLASNNSRLLSGSLDRHVKIFDISTFKVVHSMDFPNAVLSLAISEHDDILVAGMADGVISIRKKEQPSHHQTKEKKGLFKFVPDHIEVEPTAAPVVDMVVSTEKPPSETRSDKFLRQYELTKALNVVLRATVATKTPEKTVAVLQEMLRKKVLHIAMMGLDESKIGALLKFFKKNLGETRLTNTVIDATNVFIDVFESQVKFFSEQNLWLYNALQKELREEIEVCKKVSELEGAISLLLAGAQVDTSNTFEQSETLIPSAKAQKELVIDV